MVIIPILILLQLACNFSNDTSKERVVDLICCLLPLGPSRHGTGWIQTQPSDENSFHIIFKWLIKVKTSFRLFSEMKPEFKTNIETKWKTQL
jgi:hypothetical protein